MEASSTPQALVRVGHPDRLGRPTERRDRRRNTVRVHCTLADSNARRAVPMRARTAPMRARTIFYIHFVLSQPQSRMGRPVGPVGRWARRPAELRPVGGGGGDRIPATIVS